MRFTLLGLLAFAPLLELSAQEKCNVTIGGAGQDQALYAIETQDDGYALVGWTNSFGGGGWDLYLVKTDAQGAIQWTRTYGGPGDEADCSIEQLPDGGYLIASRTNSSGAGSTDFFIVRTEVDGALRWARTYGGADWDEAHSLCTDAQDDIYITGYSNSYGAGAQDVVVMRLDNEGTVQWTRTYGTADSERGHKIQLLPGGDLLIAAETRGTGAGGWDLLLMRVSADGSLRWSKTYGAVGDDFGWDARATTDGGCIFVGYTANAGAGEEDIYLMKTDGSGEPEWTRVYGGTGTDRGYSVQQTADAGFLVCGTTTGFGHGGQDILLLRTDEAGEPRWCKTYGGELSDGTIYGRATPDGGCLIGGYTSTEGWENWDFLLIKTDAEGSNGGCNEGAAVLAVAEMWPTVLVANLAIDSSVWQMMVADPVVSEGGTGEACAGTGVSDEEGAPSLAPYPNPTADRLIIPGLVDVPSGSAELYDTVGHLVLQTGPMNGRIATMDVGGLAVGTYILNVYRGGLVSHERIVKR